MFPPITRKLASLLHAEAGNSLVEVALVCGLFLVPMMVGSAELGYLVFDSLGVTQATAAAAAYGAQSPTMAADTTGITTAARANVPQLGTALSVTPSVYYACSTNIAGTRYTGAQAQTNAEAACTGTANRAVQFLQVSTTASVTPPLKFPLMPATYSLVGNAVVEVQQ